MLLLNTKPMKNKKVRLDKIILKFDSFWLTLYNIRIKKYTTLSTTIYGLIALILV